MRSPRGGLGLGGVAWVGCTCATVSGYCGRRPDGQTEPAGPWVRSGERGGLLLSVSVSRVCSVGPGGPGPGPCQQHHDDDRRGDDDPEHGSFPRIPWMVPARHGRRADRRRWADLCSKPGPTRDLRALRAGRHRPLCSLHAALCVFELAEHPAEDVGAVAVVQQGDGKDASGALLRRPGVEMAVGGASRAGARYAWRPGCSPTASRSRPTALPPQPKLGNPNRWNWLPARRTGRDRVRPRRAGTPRAGRWLTGPSQPRGSSSGRDPGNGSTGPPHRNYKRADLSRSHARTHHALISLGVSHLAVEADVRREARAECGMVGRLAPPMSRCVSCAQEGVSVRPDRCYSVDTGACPPPTAHRHERGVRGDQRRGRRGWRRKRALCWSAWKPVAAPRTRLDDASLRPAGSDCACGAPMPPMRRTRVAEGERSANPT